MSMKYFRVIKQSSWWTSVYDTGSPQYLYYDYDLERFEVGSIGACYRNGKYIFSEEEIKQIKKDYNINEEFILEEVKRARQK